MPRPLVGGGLEFFSLLLSLRVLGDLLSLIKHSWSEFAHLKRLCSDNSTINKKQVNSSRKQVNKKRT